MGVSLSHVGLGLVLKSHVIINIGDHRTENESTSFNATMQWQQAGGLSLTQRAPLPHSKTRLPVCGLQTDPSQKYSHFGLYCEPPICCHKV